MELEWPQGLGPPEAGGNNMDVEDPDTMDVDLVEGDELLIRGIQWLEEFGLRLLFEGPDLRVRTTKPPPCEIEAWLKTVFCGKTIWVYVPDDAVCEVSGKLLPREHLKEGMRLELAELDSFRVATLVDEAKARKLATRRVHTTRWVLTSKPGPQNPDRVRARLVVRDYAMGSSPLADGIYSPTTSLEALRGVLAVHAVKGGTLLSADVSVAFMQAPVQGIEVIRFPSGMSDTQGRPLFAQLHKAMNGLRVGPLSWYVEFTNTLRSSFAFGETADPTVHHRLEKDGTLTLVLVYVDDLIIYSQNPKVAKQLYQSLAKIYKMKQTGILEPGQVGQLEFLGRVIVRSFPESPIKFGLKSGYLASLGEEFGITNLKKVKIPNLERLYKEQKDVKPITREAYERYRRVLGKLMWASLTLPHLSYPVGFLGRHQNDPDSRAEACLRAVVRWVHHLPEYWQVFSTRKVFLEHEKESVIGGFVDASWNVVSVSGAILGWSGIMLKTFSRKQSVTALSSAEAELAALTEAAKEAVYLCLLMETLLTGMPSGEMSSFTASLQSDSEAAISISRMTGLLRRVRHLELRHRYLQELVRNGKLVLSFLKGEWNASDGLTKTPEGEQMLRNLLEACGLEVIGPDEVKSLRETEALKPLMAPLEEVLEAVSALPERLKKFERVARELAQGSVALLVVELFCARGSALEKACDRENVAYLGITEAEDFLHEETQAFLAEALLVLKSRQKTKVYVHIATPCTAGCSWRFWHWKRPSYRVKWRNKIKLHQKAWRLIGNLLEKYVESEDLLLTQEWPKNSGLWTEDVFLKVKRRLKLDYGRVVDRCAFDRVRKTWWFCTNKKAWCDTFSGKPCDGMHVHEAPESLEATGYYPSKLGRALLKAAKKLLLGP